MYSCDGMSWVSNATGEMCICICVYLYFRLNVFLCGMCLVSSRVRSVTPIILSRPVNCHERLHWASLSPATCANLCEQRVFVYLCICLYFHLRRNVFLCGMCLVSSVIGAPPTSTSATLVLIISPQGCAVPKKSENQMFASNIFSPEVYEPSGPNF